MPAKPHPAVREQPIPSSHSLSSSLKEIARIFENELDQKVKELVTFELYSDTTSSRYKEAFGREKIALAESVQLRELNLNLLEEVTTLKEEKRKLSIDLTEEKRELNRKNEELIEKVRTLEEDNISLQNESTAATNSVLAMESKARELCDAINDYITNPDIKTTAGIVDSLSNQHKDLKETAVAEAQMDGEPSLRDDGQQALQLQVLAPTQEKEDLKHELQNLEPIIKVMATTHNEHYLRVKKRLDNPGQVDDVEDVLAAGMMACYGGSGMVDEALFLYGSLDSITWGQMFETQHKQKVGAFGLLHPLQRRLLDCGATIRSIIPSKHGTGSGKKRAEAKKLMRGIERKFKHPRPVNSDDMIEKTVDLLEKVVRKIVELDRPKTS